MNLFGTPFGILYGYLFDESNSFSRNTRLSTLGRRFLFPVTAKHIPMPTQDHFWLNDMECRLPELVKRASRVNRVRSPDVNFGRLTKRLSTINCWRKRAFSTTKSDFDRDISWIASTTIVDVAGFVHDLIVSLTRLIRFLQAFQKAENKMIELH
ncbi:MAG: hypothetical protein GY805_12055 [Chloroflexi bacterium]|nr:hypothetical protein [Chloroflexota bacterium]